jgi:hypothetical protein
MVAQVTTGPLPAIASLLKAYGLQSFKLKTATGDYTPDAQSLEMLIDHLLAIRD